MHLLSNFQPGYFHLLVKIDSKIIRLPVNEVIFFEASNKFVKIITTQKTHLASTTLSDLEKHLFPEFFKRTHRSYIINILHLVYIADDVVNLGGYDIPISKTYADDFYLNLQLLN
jgi:DNA-binding LytR/AlgR family response regulator